MCYKERWCCRYLYLFSSQYFVLQNRRQDSILLRLYPCDVITTILSSSMHHRMIRYRQVWRTNDSRSVSHFSEHLYPCHLTFSMLSLLMSESHDTESSFLRHHQPSRCRRMSTYHGSPFVFFMSTSMIFFMMWNYKSPNVSLTKTLKSTHPFHSTSSQVEHQASCYFPVNTTLVCVINRFENFLLSLQRNVYDLDDRRRLRVISSVSDIFIAI